MTPAQTLRLAHTVRYLKPVQIYARVQKKFARARPDGSPAPGLRAVVGPWMSPVLRVSSLAQGWRVRFLNFDGEIGRPEQWNDPVKPKLWLYNLHYFDDLGAADACERRDLQRSLITRWIAENPPPAGNGWEPYPVSLRIVNWIKWHLAGEVLDQQMRDSLATQTRWLMAHVEWHLLGNHILANAKALVFAGLFFSGPEAERWLGTGLAIYARELPEQILADGSHFELSPMYHAIILEDVLDLINVARHYGCEARGPLAWLDNTAQRMRCFLAAMTHPDGKPAFFNDAAFGIAASHAELEAYAARLGLLPLAGPGEGGLHHLAASGYIRVNRGAMAVILDVAAVGPDYIPGHAHADTLSFELSLGSERIIVNGGTSTYAPGPEREAQRATRAHSTVEVDGESSSEVWAAFRVARRARITALSLKNGPDVEVVASHDGYRRLAGRNIHRRTWQIGDRSIAIADEVSGPHRAAVARFHLAPGLAVECETDGRAGSIIAASGRSIHWRSTSPSVLSPSVWNPEFGVSQGTQSLDVPLVDRRATMHFRW